MAKKTRVKLKHPQAKGQKPGNKKQYGSIPPFDNAGQAIVKACVEQASCLLQVKMYLQKDLK